MFHRDNLDNLCFLYFQLKWLMYWIVFAFFTSIETFTDVLISWFPFYYEIKVGAVLYVLSPATEGSSILYRKFVQPMLDKREKVILCLHLPFSILLFIRFFALRRQEIDEYINQAKEKGYTAVIELGTKSMNYATNVIMQTAFRVRLD